MNIFFGVFISTTDFNFSPNDTIKKGNSKCNEILSSLSSSSYMLSPPLKRSSPPLKRTKDNSPSNSLPQGKRLQSDQHIETPTIDVTIDSVPKPSEKVPEKVVREKIYPTEPTQPKLTLFNRPYSSNSAAVPPVRNHRNDECNIPFVKPRPMTARSRESVENWLKIKPDEKRRLSMMLSCLSGEVYDGDTVDSKDKVNEPPKTVNSIAASENPTKEVSVEKNATENRTSETVTSTAQIITSTTTSLLPSKPAVTVNPISSVSTPSEKAILATSVSLPSTIAAAPAILPTATVQAGQTIEERKGGFSFPVAAKETPQTNVATTVVVTPASPPSTVTFAALPTTFGSSNLSDSAKTVAFAANNQSNSTNLFTVTPAPATTSTSIISKDSTPSVTFTFQPPKPNVTSPVVPAAEPTKTFTFGTATNESKSSPVFGSSTTVEQTVKQTTSGTLVQPKAFTGFGQTASPGTVNFGKAMPANTFTSNVASSNTPSFGTMTSSNAFTKAPPLSFGSMSSTQQTLTNNKPMQSNATSSFSKNEPSPVFGSVLPGSNNTAQKQLDSRPSNQLINPTTASAIGSSFAFGASTGASDAAATNIFGSMAPQTSTITPVFGSSANTNTNLFDQTPKVGSKQSPLQNSTDAEKNVATQNIFGSSAKPTSTFSFSANNQPNNVFGGQTSTGSGNGNAFSFGGSNQKSDSSASNLGGTSKSFTFSGNNETTKPSAFGSKPDLPAFGSKPDLPAFGSSNITDSAKSGFAANNQSSSTNLFNNKSTDEVPKVFSFGGGTNNTPAAATFGGASNVPTFGSNSTFGGSNNKPTFGGSNSMTTFGGNNAGPVAFGGASAFGNSNATPTFGATNATAIFGGTNASPAFGATNATPSFGGGMKAATQSFGGTNAPPAYGANNAAPSFGVSNSTPVFGATNPPSTFGSGGQAFSANIGTPSFGANSSNNSTFSGNSGTPAAFTTSTGTADVNKSFNFTGNDPAPSPVPNLFNIGPGSPAPRGRTIRTATRRTYR